jgi:hypothetical protein
VGVLVQPWRGAGKLRVPFEMAFPATLAIKEDFPSVRENRLVALQLLPEKRYLGVGEAHEPRRGGGRIRTELSGVGERYLPSHYRTV